MIYSSNMNTLRKSYSKIEQLISIPNLIEIQKKSYEKFLQLNCKPEEREDKGLQSVFKSVFPIKDFNGTSSLEFVSYSLEEPKYKVDECRQRGMTYAAPLKVTIRLIVWDVNENSELQHIRDVKEQEVYFGEIPLMTDNGTFIINGTERVVVSQLHRSPGVFFDHDKGRTHSTGKLLYSARIIPYRGSWIDFEFDLKDILHLRIDRRRKMPATILLKALGYSTQELIDMFYPKEKLIIKEDKIEKEINPEILIGQKVSLDIYTPDLKELIIQKGRKITKKSLKIFESLNLTRIPVLEEDIINKVCANDVVDMETGEIILECNEKITSEKLKELRKRNITELYILFIDDITVNSSLRDTLAIDKIETSEEAVVEIYKRLRPGEPPTLETAKALFENLFFKPERYDLSKVGRVKLNYKLNLDTPEDLQILRKEDILAVVKYLLDLRNGKGEVDDIDHLGNRRIRAVGELVENQYRIGLVRMERSIKERMSIQDVDTLMPHDLINAKPVSAVIKEFFGSNQLSQFMDQTNPLSEITHKRRLSALGPGGLTRERAGFEVRDVHNTHYGRICPIETPEGPNIGLIASLSTYARVNEYGFIETPYRKVINGRVTKEVVFLSALEEERYCIAQANALLDSKGYFIDEMVTAREGGEFSMVPREKIEYMDVSPNQLVSVAASLIPFLEHDDANRALMGSNMQRQAVPLMKTTAPLIGTGIEQVVAKDSGVAVIARRSGVVESVDASRIVIKVDDSTQDIYNHKEGEEYNTDDHESGVDIYNLIKYQRSNQNTCINQKPLVKKGQFVKAGEIIADGPATDHGELALGHNVIVAFMPWGGYNFEDSILISERLIKNDFFTSIHIEEFEAIARDTKLGKEEITRDIPNVGEEALKNLDESGIIRIGAEVKPNDILVGKVTPKGETQLSPEEKLLRAIFGEKAGDVKDTSLTVPPGVSGIVISAKVFSRKGIDKDERAKYIEDKEIQKISQDLEDEKRISRESTLKKLKKLLVNQVIASSIYDDDGKVIIGRKEVITESKLEKVPPEKWIEISIDNDSIQEELERINEEYQEQIHTINYIFEGKIERLKKGDELPPGVIKIVKVYIAIKRKLSVGDKMAGRHGNKGVLSRILPEEDMPYLPDGTPVDMVLNPLGVPSRMNVGQILETHLGWAAYEMGKQIDDFIRQNYSPEAIKEKMKLYYNSPEFNKFLDKLSPEEIIKVAERLRNGIFISSPVFDGATEKEIRSALKLVNLPESGQSVLFDGRTGEPFAKDVTVGVMYMLKLHHLVDDKIHARSIGPYSLVTQQPLGGKAQFGGQRLGEMEVWALEAYGAAYGLQEFLTVKSDDVIGRTKMYESIVKGENALEPGLPESFNVLIKELQSLGLNVELIENKDL